MTRCASGPWNKSRTIARATTLPAPPPMPCKIRPSHNISTLVANAAQREPTIKIPKPILIVSMRPIASEIAP